MGAERAEADDDNERGINTGADTETEVGGTDDDDDDEEEKVECDEVTGYEDDSEE